jgi:hypothetical protein
MSIKSGAYTFDKAKPAVRQGRKATGPKTSF